MTRPRHPGCPADTRCVSDIWEGLSLAECSKPASVSCRDHPAKPVVLIVMNFDDPGTREGLALQGIDTSIGKTCFWCELMKLLAQPGSLACKGKILGKGRQKTMECLNAAASGRREDSDFWVLVSWDACLLLLLDLSLYHLHGWTGFCSFWGAILQHYPSCRDHPGITAAGLHS